MAMQLLVAYFQSTVAYCMMQQRGSGKTEKKFLAGLDCDQLLIIFQTG
jgi:hypothetical protein